MFQAENDVGHGVNAAIHSFRTNELDFEPMSLEQSADRFAGEIVEMRWRMNLTPPASSGLSEPTVEVARRQRQKTSPRKRIRYFLEVKIRPGQMLDGVPKTNEIGRSDKLMG